MALGEEETCNLNPDDHLRGRLGRGPALGSPAQTKQETSHGKRLTAALPTRRCDQNSRTGQIFKGSTRAVSLKGSGSSQPWLEMKCLVGLAGVAGELKRPTQSAGGGELPGAAANSALLRNSPGGVIHFPEN